MSCRFQPDYRADAMYRGDAMGRIEPCLDFTFDIVNGLFVPAPVDPGMLPFDLFRNIDCGETITNLEITDRSRHALYRTTDLTENQSYSARFFNARADVEGEYMVVLNNVIGFNPYITVHRSGTIQWQGVGDMLEFSVSASQTGPVTIEVSTVNRYEQGSFDVTYICPGEMATIQEPFYVSNVNIPYRFGGDSTNNDDTPLGSHPFFVFTNDLADSVEWVLASGALPPGLTLDSVSGLVSGTPTAVGVYSFAIRVKKDGIVRGSRDFVCKIVNSIVVQETADIINWFNSLPDDGFGNPVVVASFNGAMHVVGDSEQSEETWKWNGKGFLATPYPAGFRGMGFQLNQGIPRTIRLTTFLGTDDIWTKTDSSPQAVGTYSHTAGPIDSPIVLTVI